MGLIKGKRAFMGIILQISGLIQNFNIGFEKNDIKVDLRNKIFLELEVIY
jgi:hypothetical protein